MSYKEINMYVDSSMYKYKCPYSMVAWGVCVHNTYNNAPAENEATNMRKSSNKKRISFHDVVDDKYVVHCIPHNRNAFHAGDGTEGKGNRHYIGVEICYSKSGGPQFDQAEVNAAEYIAKILKAHGWGIDRVFRHYDFSGKDCPHRTIDYGWYRFLNMISAAMNDESIIIAQTKLEPDGDWGKATSRAAQTVYGTPVDGIISRQPKVNKEYLPNCYTTSWKFPVIYIGGSQCIKAIQQDLKDRGHYKGIVDGYFGPKSVVALQEFLKVKKFYGGAVDGLMGPKSVTAFQQYLNTLL